MQSRFERFVDPYPDAPPSVPPASFFPFLWHCTQGLRPLLLAGHQPELSHPGVWVKNFALNGLAGPTHGFVQAEDGEKMSKSLGNFFTIRDVLARYQPEVLRFFLLSSHYRSALNYSDAALDAAREGLTRFYLALDRAGAGADSAPDGEFVARFDAAMQDDFNTPGAIAVLFELVRELNRAEAPGRVAALAATLRHLGGVLGLLQDDPQAFLKGGAAGEGPSDADIDALVQARLDARKARDFALADAIRAELTDAADLGSPLCLAEELAGEDLSGQIIVCDRGNTGRVEKGQVVAALGAEGMILANDQASGNSLNGDAHALPFLDGCLDFIGQQRREFRFDAKMMALTGASSRMSRNKRCQRGARAERARSSL